MKKRIINETIFEKKYDGINNRIKISDLPVDLKYSDIIDIEKIEDSYDDGNGNGNDASFTILKIIREREETEYERAEFLNHLKELKEVSKKKRYNEYLKLKKEFENE